MNEMLLRICDGRGSMEDLDRIEELSESIVLGSLCALGKSGPNPVLSTLQYFRDEYEAHIKDKRCPAGVCKGLITYSIDNDKCDGCGACLPACVSEAVLGTAKKAETFKIVDLKCDRCGACAAVCKRDAVIVQ